MQRIILLFFYFHLLFANRPFARQDVREPEKTGFDLWANCRDCQRRTLPTKNNFGHNTLAINDRMQKLDGKATSLELKEGDRPEVVFDITNQKESITQFNKIRHKTEPTPRGVFRTVHLFKS